MTISTSLPIISTAAALLKNAAAFAKTNPYTAAAVTVGGIAATGIAAANKLSQPTPITSLSRQTMISSRVFIDESVLDEPGLSNLMQVIHKWYVAQILTALGLQKMVGGGKTVGTVLSAVQTGYNKKYIGFEDFGAFEALSYVSPAAKRKAETPKETPSSSPNTKPVPTELRKVDTGDKKIGPIGELYEIKMAHPDNPEYSVTVPVYVQMQPTIIPHQFAARFIDVNSGADIWKRWIQWSAGEISFLKDLVLNVDRIKKYQDVVKDPEASKAFTEFLKSANKKDSYAAKTTLFKTRVPESSNLANSVMIFSEDAVAQAKIDSGTDLHNANDRQRYFDGTYTMIVVIMDPLHQRVTIYFNGIDGDLNISYNDLKHKNTDFEADDFVKALQAFSTNAVGRLR